ncbi:hypothetical protein KSP40_PGU008636 [Platanthera guangdongensis]|uniref:Uncharacterized protein n=1 Tax=Platanthera guangdongensis TaxID=2320717 RepID=A0ABR2LK40_9ASPA
MAEAGLPRKEIRCSPDARHSHFPPLLSFPRDPAPAVWTGEAGDWESHQCGKGGDGATQPGRQGGCLDGAPEKEQVATLPPSTGEEDTTQDAEMGWAAKGPPAPGEEVLIGVAARGLPDLGGPARAAGCKKRGAALPNRQRGRPERASIRRPDLGGPAPSRGARRGAGGHATARPREDNAAQIGVPKKGRAEAATTAAAVAATVATATMAVVEAVITPETLQPLFLRTGSFPGPSIPRGRKGRRPEPGVRTNAQEDNNIGRKKAKKRWWWWSRDKESYLVGDSDALPLPMFYPGSSPAKPVEIDRRVQCDPTIQVWAVLP